MSPPSRSKLKFPWTQSPLVVNAPMGSVARSKLAIAVSSAGGLGLIGSVNDMEGLTSGLQQVHEHFSSSPLKDFNYETSATLPVGVGFLIFINSLDAATNAIKNSPKPPAIIWLFAAPDPDPVAVYAKWTSSLRKDFPNTQIWIQSGGSVGLAVRTVQQAQPDVLVIQGSDAGGHGTETGASLLSLLPETIDTLAASGVDIPIVAAGGITDSRAAAAAFALGAGGVVMGTRFLASEEVSLPHPEYQKRIIAATDGAASTVRAKVFDELQGKNQWPPSYDGRALVSASYKDWKDGVSAEEIINRMKKETDLGQEGSMGYGFESDRAAIWAGSGVGLVKKVMPAGEIVREVRDGIGRVVDGVRSRERLSEMSLDMS